MHTCTADETGTHPILKQGCLLTGCQKDTRHPSGLQYDSTEDALEINKFYGSFFVIPNISLIVLQIS